jgi:hypothetical protein
VQLFGLRYGTIDSPVVARTGGLADTVIDANEAALEDGVATSSQFAPGDAWALADAIRRAVHLHHRPEARGRLVERAVTRDVGWDRAARRYLELYRRLLAARSGGPGLISTACGERDPIASAGWPLRRSNTDDLGDDLECTKTDHSRRLGARGAVAAAAGSAARSLERHASWMLRPSCLAAERCWDQARWAVETYAWRFDGLDRARRAGGTA